MVRYYGWINPTPRFHAWLWLKRADGTEYGERYPRRFARETLPRFHSKLPARRRRFGVWTRGCVVKFGAR